MPKKRSDDQLQNDALQIWKAGIRAVLPKQLFQEYVHVEEGLLYLGDEVVQLSNVRKIVVVGAGKAAAAMAVGLETSLGPKILAEKKVTGWVNIPAGTKLATQAIHLHVARPAAINEPTKEAVEGTQKILQLVSTMQPQDLCICLLSGGGSALLSAPPSEVPLAEKTELARQLSAAGATIEELNTVRQQVSHVKGGKLAAACQAGQLISLVISDVAGDPLEMIASGPTTPLKKNALDALNILEKHHLTSHPRLVSLVGYLQQAVNTNQEKTTISSPRISHVILANNSVAVDAAGIEAERLGYSHAMLSSATLEEDVSIIAKRLAPVVLQMRNASGPDCLITGGEPTVILSDEKNRGKGGRNQQLVLHMLQELGDCVELAMLSGGTDGEDGPTDAAGALITQKIASQIRAKGFDIPKHLTQNNAYPVFNEVGALIKTGPTNTNVCDLRVMVVARKNDSP